MKIKILFIALLVSSFSWGQTTVTIGGGATVTCPATPTATWTTPPTGVTFSNWSRGSGVTCASAGTALSGSGFNTASAAASYSANKYYSFTITTNAATIFTLNNIVWNTAISSGGGNFTIQYINNGGALTTFGTPAQTGTTTNTFSGSVSVAASTSIVIYLIPFGIGAAGTTVRLVNGSTVNITVTPPTVTPASLTGTVGTAFTYNVIASGAPTSYAYTGTLPAGLSFNTATGAITGNPTASGASSISVTATNSGGTSTAATITFNIDPNAVPVVTASTFSGIVGNAFSNTIIATNPLISTYTFVSGTYPPGLSLNSSTGVISGTPTTTGTYTIQVTATNVVGTSTPSTTITFNIYALPVVTASTFAGTVGTAFSNNIIATNSPTIYAITSGTLVAGLSFNTATGAITGTPTASGTSTISVTATNPAGTSTAATITFNINPNAIPVVTASTFTGIVGNAFSNTIIATNPVISTYTFVSGTYPPGLSLNSSTGVISGTPSALGTYTIQVTATNIVGTSTPSTTITFNIYAIPVVTASTFAGTVGTAFSNNIVATSSPTSYAITSGTIPSGLTFNTSTGAITGTPTASGTSTISVTATNPAGTSTAATITFNIDPNAIPVVTGSAQTGLVGTAFSYSILATNPVISSYTFTGTLPPGLSLNSSTGVISGTPTTSGGYSIQATATNVVGPSVAVTITFTINAIPVVTASTFTGTVGTVFSNNIVATNSPTSYAIVSGTLPGGLSFNTSTGAITGTPTASGSSTISVTATSPAGTSTAATITFNINPNAIPVVSSSSQLGTISTAFSYSISATNPVITSYNYVSGTYPPGLTLNTSTGVISGTPTTAGSYSVLVTATNVVGTSTPATTITFDICPGTQPLNGTYSIPSTCFPTMLSAVTYLNSYGVAGVVIFNVAAGYTETAPSGGFSLTVTGTVANTITFRKSGAGTNPTFTAFTPQPSSSLTNAIFKIIGGDYITIDGFTMQENAGNTVTAAASNTMTEFGVALFYALTTNGAQNNTIQNNTISLNRTYLNTFGIYSTSRTSATSVTVAADATSTAGANSNNKVYTNTISNVNYGIVFIGNTTAANMDTGNDIGGSSAGTGNTITNWGGGAALSAYVNLTGSSYCIFSNHQNNDNISFNTITSGTLTQLNTCGGILKNYSVAQPTGTITTTINNNTVTVTNNPTAATTGGIVGINNQGLTALLATATMSMNNNTVQNCVLGGGTSTTNGITGITNLSVPGTMNITGNTVQTNSITATTATTGGFSGITNSGAATTVNMTGNTILSNAITATSSTSGQLTGMSNSGAGGTVNMNSNIVRSLASTATSGQIRGIVNTGAVVTALNINNNQLGNATGGFFTSSVPSSGTLYGISSSGGASTCATAVTGNDIRGITYSVTASAVQTYINSIGTPLTNTISNNTFTNLSVNTTGNIYLIYNTYTAPANGSKTISGNTIVTGFSRTAGGIGNFYGYYDLGSSPSSVSHNITNNIFSNITINSSNSGELDGIDSEDYLSSNPALTITNNTMSNWTNGSGDVYAIYADGFAGTSGSPNVVSGNTISNISTTGAAVVYGLYVGTTTAYLNVYSNSVSQLKGLINATGNDIIGIFSNGATGAVNIYKNNVNGLSGIGFATTVTGIYSVAAANRTIYNNLIGDLTATASTSLRAIEGISVFGGTTSNIYYNTVYFTGTSSAANFGSSALYADNTSTILDLRNNILINTSTPKGTGRTTAFNIPLAYNATYYVSTSNNNLFYAGTPGASNLIFYDGTNSDQTLAAFQTRVGPTSDVDSVTEPFFNAATYFESIIGSNSLYLKPKSLCNVSSANNAGAPIGSITNDYNSAVRDATTPDIGAWEFDSHGKRWNGTIDAKWNTIKNWTPKGIPSATDCVFISAGTTNAAVISGDNYDALALNLTVENGASLTVNSGNTAGLGNTLTVTDSVIVANILPKGSLIINNNSSLVQVTDVDNATTNTNSGDITYIRTTRAMRTYDYVYWGSPITKAGSFSQIPSAFDRYYKFVTTGGMNGTYTPLTTDNIAGQGYITRVKNDPLYTPTPYPINYSFVGTPNNGVVNITATNYDTSSLVSGNTILLGNPYPSAIDADAFIAANIKPGSPGPSTITGTINQTIGGALYFWTSGTAYPGTGNYNFADYCTYTKLGIANGVPGVAVGGLNATGKIAAGQGFFAQIFASGLITFNNSMRLATNNANFFRSTNPSTTATTTEGKHRIWLNYTNASSNSNTAFRQMLVGYADGATNGIDNIYDGHSFTNNQIDFYSIVDNENFSVQARALPFLDTDLVPLGFRTTTTGDYIINIDHVDGLFAEGQPIFLEDKELNIIYDLRTAPYSFNASAGRFDDRFVLRYTNNALSNPNFETLNNSVVVAVNNHELTIKSYIENMQEVTVYDILGRQLFQAKNINNNNFLGSNISLSQQTLIVKIKLENGVTISRKIIL